MITLTYPQITGRRLERNHLLARASAGKLVQVVRDTCGIQAQVTAAAELGISARLSDITREDVRDALWKHRTLVRTSATRETKHILASDELPLWMAAMRAAMPLRPQQSKPRYTPAELAAMIHWLKEALDGFTLTREELAAKVARQGGSRFNEQLISPWGEILDRAFYEGVMVHGPGEGNEATFARPDQWLGSWQDLDPTESLNEVCRRYIATYGPVTHGDFARWFWITPDAARGVFDSIRGELEEAKVERRRAWVLASDANVGWEPVEGSVRLVPQYDCYILGSYPREPIVPEEFKAFMRTLKRATYEGAVGLPLLLLDGVVAGMWQRRQRAKAVDITVTPIVALTPHQREQLEAEAARIGAFLGVQANLTVAPPE
jgi:DNA glycosylase AlkZ-like